jgi:uncharacterized MAPEG superfamily protein
MKLELSVEFYWLLLTILVTSLMWMPYIINRMREEGILSALWDRFGLTEAKAPWANRMMRAHENAIENLVVFAPLVILVSLANSSTGVTLLAVKLYFFARLVHYLVYSLAMPVLRVVSFLTGFVAQLMLIASLLV